MVKVYADWINGTAIERRKDTGWELRLKDGRRATVSVEPADA